MVTIAAELTVCLAKHVAMNAITGITDIANAETTDMTGGTAGTKDVMNVETIDTMNAGMIDVTGVTVTITGVGNQML